MNASHIKYPQGRYNPAGITRILYAYSEDIETFPVLADSETAASLDLLVKMTTAITMKADKQFFELYSTIEEAELKSNIVGPRDGKGFESMLDISYPGNDPVILGFEASIANRTVVLLIKEKNNVWRVLGSPDDPAYFESGESTSGKKIADGRTKKMSFKASGPTAPPIYAPTGGVESLLVPGT